MASRVASPCSVVLGGDRYVNAQHVKSLRAEAQLAHPERETIELDAAGATGFDFIQATSPTLLSDAATVVVTGYENAPDDLGEAIAAWLREASGDPQASRVIVSHGGGPKGKRLLDMLFKAGAERIDVPDLAKPQARLNYVFQQFEARGRRVEPEAAQQLAGVLGDDIGELTAMIGQLCFDFDDPVIGIGRVNQYLSSNPQVTGFQVADAALAGHAGHAVVALRDALEQGVEPIALIGALALKMRTLAKAAAVRGGQISQAEARTNPWVLKNAQRQLPGWTSQGLSACIQTLAWADEQCKTNGADPAYALERCVTLIAAKGIGR